jgi:dihydroorotase
MSNSFGYTVWLRPQELHLGKGVAASGPLATRMGLSGVPVAAETIALHTIFELLKSIKAHVHLCRISSAAGVALVRQAKAEGLAVTCDVSINSLHLTDADVGTSTVVRACHPLCANSAIEKPCAKLWPTAPSMLWCPITAP